MEKTIKLQKFEGSLINEWDIGKDIHIPASNILYYEGLYHTNTLEEKHINYIKNTKLRELVKTNTGEYFGARIVLKETQSNGNFVEFNVIQTPNEISKQFEV